MLRLAIAFCTVFLLQLSHLFGMEKNDSPYIIPPPLKNLDKKYKLRIVYFVPSDKKVKKDYRQKASVLMRVVSDVYKEKSRLMGFILRDWILSLIKMVR